METQIRTLKGELTENANGYDPTCTHVVCEAPTRSEKIFSSIAAGKWILKTNYIEDSAAVGHFLNVTCANFFYGMNVVAKLFVVFFFRKSCTSGVIQSPRDIMKNFLRLVELLIVGERSCRPKENLPFSANSKRSYT